jgi:hypothetical protein
MLEAGVKEGDWWEEMTKTQKAGCLSFGVRELRRGGNCFTSTGNWAAVLENVPFGKISLYCTRICVRFAWRYKMRHISTFLPIYINVAKPRNSIQAKVLLTMAFIVESHFVN